MKNREILEGLLNTLSAKKIAVVTLEPLGKRQKKYIAGAAYPSKHWRRRWPCKSLSVRAFHQLSTLNHQLPIEVVTNYNFNRTDGKMTE
jgi:hypothetical protein